MTIGMLSTDVLADTPGVQSNGLDSYVVEVSSDPSTSARPSTFGTASDDGRVWADKSVAVNDNNFDVTLSALAQEYVRTSTIVVKEQAAADVAIVIDLSASMTADRITRMKDAVNKGMDIIMAANPKNRIGIYYYGLATGTTSGNPNTGTLLPLASYSTTGTGDGSDATDRYFTSSGQTITRKAGITQKYFGGATGTTTAQTISTSSGTATQFGLYTAVNALKTDIASRTKGTDQERIPYVLLLTDGEANRAYPNWYNDLTNSSARGTEIAGSGASGTAQISALTILTAAKLKDELGQAYKTYNGNDKDVVWFNVAFGLTEGDNLATASLKPDLLSSTATTTLKSVYTQLNTYTTSAPAAYKKYGVSGSPGYLYAKDYIYFVSPTDLKKVDEALEALAELVEAATQEKIIPFEQVNEYGDPLSLLVTDLLGDGMELKTAPKLQGTTGTIKSTSGTVTTYEFTGFGTTVTYDSATREMKWNILPAEIPLIMFSDRKKPTPDAYSNPDLAPMQLTYTVGLKDVYKSDTFYSNEYAGTATAATRFIPMTENPYYYKGISEVGGVITSTCKIIGTDIVQSGLKSSNITGTAISVYANEWVVEGADNVFITKLGNNGKIAPKMKIDKAPVSGSVPAGGNASYYITITNLTGNDISNVIVDDTLPAGLTFVVGSIKEGSDSKPTATFPYTINSVPANSSVVLTFQAAVPLGAAIGTEYVNKAKITSANGIALTTPATVDSGKVTVANTFSPQVTTKLDGTDYTGQTVTLWQGGMSKYTLSGSGSVYTLSNVTPGTYDIYVNGVNTGVQLSASDANKEINYYSVSFYDGDTKYTTPAAQTILSGGKAVSPTAPTKMGYTFDKWVTTSGGTIEFDFNKAITATTNVYATWTANTNTAYKVNHYQAGLDGKYPATPTEVENLSGTTGGTTAAAAKTYTGFTAKAFSQTTIAADGSTVVDVYYDKSVYAVDYDANGGTGSLPSGGNQEYESNVTVQFTPQPTRTGYSFVGWAKNAGGTAEYTATGTTIFIMPAKDVTLYAVWNAVPVAGDDSIIIQKGELVTIPVLENDTDAEGDKLTVTITSGPSHGTAIVNPDGTVTYTPNSSYTGEDSFTYTVSDDKGGTDTARVTVSVNAPPIAVDDTAVAPINTPVVISLLANDTDADRDSLTIASVTQPVHGQVEIDSERYNKTVTYTPNPGFTGTDTFTYIVSDGRGGTGMATVTVTVTDDTTVVTNNAPNAIDDTATTPVNVPVTISVLTNDTDPNGDDLTIISVTEALILDDNGDVTATSVGSVTISDDKQKVTYIPATDFAGKVIFTYTISDGHGGTDTAKATVTVYETTIPTVNANPVAADDNAFTAKNKPVTIAVLTNDTDADGDTLTIESVTQPGNGNVEINPDGTVTYTPDPGYKGDDTFTYAVSDGKGGTASATVKVNVYDTANNAPIAKDDSASTPMQRPVTIAVLTNDTDVDGDLLKIESINQPGNGNVKINVDGTVTYTPNPGYKGDDSFTYIVSDGKGGTDIATVTVMVYEIAVANNAPEVNDDSVSTAKNTAVTVTVLANDTDADGDSLTVTDVSDPDHGTIVLNPDGTITYTPNKGYTGSDSFTYTVTDGKGGTATATVTITVYETTIANHAPIAADDSVSTPMERPVTIAVLTNDTDADGDTLTVTGVTTPDNGSVTINADGTVAYTPNAGYKGNDTFTYTVSDGKGGTASATVTVTVYETTVTPVNNAPMAKDDSASTPMEKPVTIAVLTNDTDADGDTLTVTDVTPPGNGSVKINADLTVTYTPNAGYKGTDSFTYTVIDGKGGTATATVTVTVYETIAPPVNNAPVAKDDNASTAKNKAVTIAVLANDNDADGDILTVTSVAIPGNGTADINADGTVTYTPTTDFTGTDSFTYTVSDGKGGSATASVNVNVYGTTNTAPKAVNDNASTPMGKPVTIAVLTNDTDADGDALSIKGATQPGNGSITINADETVTYTPNAGYKGDDSFTYTVSDGKGGTATATVTITVYETSASGNTVPIAVDDTATTPTNKPVVIAVLANDSDADGDALTIKSVTQPVNGSVTINADGTVIYTPNTNYKGNDTFEYTISDGKGATAKATVTVTVQEIIGNKPPVAVDDNAVTSMGIAVVIPVLVNDWDPDGDPLTITKANSNNSFANGTVTISADKKTVTYVPKSGYTGTDTFTYTISDGKGGVATATVTVRVNVPAPHNNKPHAVDDDVTAPMNTVKVIDVLTNDTDADGDPLTVTSVTKPLHGKATISADKKTVTYEPDPGYEGEDTFTYTISDGKGGNDTATVKLLVGTHVVIYNANGGSGSVPGDNTRYKNNDTVLVLFTPAPTRAGYAFMGWADNNAADALAQYTEKGSKELTMGTSDITLYAIWSKCIVTLKAEPKSIVGNGKTQTKLTATVTDVSGNPVEGVKVEFAASEYNTDANFKGGKTAETNNKGEAIIYYYSTNLESTDASKPTILTPVEFRITATVNDIPKELHAQDWFDITFVPGTLQGVLYETNDEGIRSPIKDTVITISLDHAGRSWSKILTTDAEGRYSTYVPWAGETYQITYNKPITDNTGKPLTDSDGKPIIAEYKQNGTTDLDKVGEGGTYDSEITIAGIILKKDEVTQAKNLLEDVSHYSVKIYEGATVTPGQSPIANADHPPAGVFNIAIASPDPTVSTYTVAIFYADPVTGKEVIAGVKQVTIDQNGAMTVSETLIDPYGTITDKSTHAAIKGAEVTLYYYDTNTKVTLPVVPGFAPRNNESPTQYTDDFYAFMVYPHTRYYIKATAPAEAVGLSLRRRRIRLIWRLRSSLQV